MFFDARKISAGAALTLMLNSLAVPFVEGQSMQVRKNKNRVELTAGSTSSAMGIDHYEVTGGVEDVTVESYSATNSPRTLYQVVQLEEWVWEMFMSSPLGTGVITIEYVPGVLDTVRLTAEGHVVTLDEQEDGTWSRGYFPGNEPLPMDVYGDILYDASRWNEDFVDFASVRLDGHLGGGVTDDILNDLRFGSGGGRGSIVGGSGGNTSPPNLDPKKHDASCFYCAAQAVVAGPAAAACIVGAATAVTGVGIAVAAIGCTATALTIAGLADCSQGCTTKNIAVDAEDLLGYFDQIRDRFDVSNYAHVTVEDFIRRLGTDFDPGVEGSELIHRLGDLQGFLSEHNIEEQDLANQIDLFSDTQLFVAGGIQPPALALP